MRRKSHRVGFALGGALVAVAAGLVALAAFVGSGPKPTVQADPHGNPIVNVRTILVATDDSIGISEPGRQLRAVLAEGTIPTAPTMATVMSDENCAPDAQGVSHCRNRLRMEDGTEMAVTHPHRMSEVPCLSPGEQVRVQAA